MHPSHHHYYFGDYYHEDFVRIGFHPWYDLHAYHHGYDPMWSYYRWDHARRGVDLEVRLRGWHTYYERKPDLRPAHVFVVGSHLVQPGHGPHEAGHPPMLGVSFREAVASPAAGKRFVALTPAEVKAVHGSAGSMNGLVTERRGHEVAKPSAGRLAAGAGTPNAGGVTSAKPSAAWKLPESASSVRAGVGKTNPSPTGAGGGAQPGNGHATPRAFSGGAPAAPQTQPAHGRPNGMVPQSPPHQSQASKPSDKTRGKPKSDRREGTSVR
ncbi:MAG: hypothetical protein NTY19_26520 [Planctomycetota bacterium]|nr:hypothetical protein [Planctomycetota bacterium]